MEIYYVRGGSGKEKISLKAKTIQISKYLTSILNTLLLALSFTEIGRLRLSTRTSSKRV